MVETPVLYITFARPEYASQSFAAIKKAQPRKLYFYSNKAREEIPEEVGRNEEIRSYVKNIDWDCEVKIWFREEYVDVFTSLWGAIDWVFDNEEKAIVIEEDVVASLAFFDYIDKLIDKYQHNEKIWMISGNNALPNSSPQGMSYFPTRYADIYGWASWRSVWKSLDRELSYWPMYRNSKEYKRYFNSNFISLLFKIKGDNLYNKIKGNYRPWDMIFNNNMRKNNAYCLIPYTNLAKDIGIVGANHSIAEFSPLSVVDIDSTVFEISRIPNEIVPTKYDFDYVYKYMLKGYKHRKIIKLKDILLRKR